MLLVLLLFLFCGCRHSLRHRNASYFSSSAFSCLLDCHRHRSSSPLSFILPNAETNHWNKKTKKKILFGTALGRTAPLLMHIYIFTNRHIIAHSAKIILIKKNSCLKSNSSQEMEFNIYYSCNVYFAQSKWIKCALNVGTYLNRNKSANQQQ